MMLTKSSHSAAEQSAAMLLEMKIAVVYLTRIAGHIHCTSLLQMPKDAIAGCAGADLSR